MIRKAGRFNIKRRIDPKVTEDELKGWIEALTYGGNPEHKRNPGDFGLTPPAAPRPDKSLCDDVRIFRRKDALAILRAGLRRGLVSVQRVHGIPQNIWSVTDTGVAIEGQLENFERHSYHAYPMPASDPFAAIVLEGWKANG